MTDYILKHRRDIDRARLSDMLANDTGAAKLEVNLYYSKDGRRRGLILSIYRTLETDFGSSYDIMNRHNGLVHLVPLPRKPAPKVAEAWRAIVESKLDAIATIALSSDSPDWSQIKDLFTEESTDA